MKVARLKEILSGYPDDMEVVAGIELGDDKPTVELRDILDRDTGACVKTVLQLRHWNYGKSAGWRICQKRSVINSALSFLMGWRT